MYENMPSELVKVLQMRMNNAFVFYETREALEFAVIAFRKDQRTIRFGRLMVINGGSVNEV